MKYLVRVFDAERVDKVYYLLAALRFLLTLIPQKGYIHPDEFFQSVEVLAGDVFDIESNRPWEFNQTFPIRSIFAPYMMIGVPYKIIQSFDSILQLYFGVTLKTPYWLVVLPRIHYCLFSFLIDYCLFKICAIHYEKYKGKLLLLASSYVIQVYGTHTFSNTVEMVLMSILLYLVVDSHTYSYAVVKQDEFLKKKYDESIEAIDRARLYKVKAALPSHTLRHCIIISFIVTMGVFNRPTFIAFAFPCVFFWIYRGIGYKIVTLSEIHIRMLLFVFNCLLFSCLFVIIDSTYFGYLSIVEIMQMDISIRNFVVTPLNFIKYNMDVNKLSDHGLHPRFLHLLVNIPLLYNVLGIVAIGALTTFTVRLISGRYRSLPSIYDIRCLMTAAIFFPIATLSYFPHQEARFLIPVTLPLVYMYGDAVAGRKALRRLWWLLNVVCLVFFGFVHQAGLLPLATHLSRDLQQGGQLQLQLVTCHVYSLPVSLLTQRDSRRLYGTGASRYRLPRALELHELGSASTGELVRWLQRVPRNGRVFLALPISKERDLQDYIHATSVPMSLDEVETFYPHISTEAMPNLFCDSYEDCTTLSVSYFINVAYNFVKSCGLGLYKVYYNETVTLINKNAFI